MGMLLPDREVVAFLTQLDEKMLSSVLLRTWKDIERDGKVFAFKMFC